MVYRSLSVIIPSRRQPLQVQYLRRAVRSIRQQSAYSAFGVHILIGVDEGEGLPENIRMELGISCHQSSTRSQAAALNACLSQVSTDLVAFLEDDDEWHPEYLATASQCLAFSGHSFITSTQAEYDDVGEFLRVNDFPTPSGWLMTTATSRRIGLFDESYKFHLDNEYLGRCARYEIARSHLVEAYAPTNIALASQIRPWLATLVRHSAQTCTLVRHSQPAPLVRRLIHAGSGMHQISVNPEHKNRSRAEIDRLVTDFGRIPW